MDLKADPRTVLTLDMGSPAPIFSAVKGGEILAESSGLPPLPEDSEASLEGVCQGFETLLRGAEPAHAIALAHPRPLDCSAGVVLPGSTAPRPFPLGPLLEERFRLPVFLGRAGDLFTLGEAQGGFLPWINGRLERGRNPRRYRSLLGILLDARLRAGLVAEGRMLTGDLGASLGLGAQAGGLALRAHYAAAAGCDPAPGPREIYDIAKGRKPGDAQAARDAFHAMGREAGEAIARLLALVDGPVVLGGQLVGAAEFFLPALVAGLAAGPSDEGSPTSGVPPRIYDLEDSTQRLAFLASQAAPLAVPGTDRTVTYEAQHCLGVGLTRLGTGQAIALGAWAHALRSLGSVH